eukprot:m.249403 g.249403  ORF g.249403 m.249403 type:complete len:581 (+) comp15879_c0_seq2:268-2010(+)
MYGTLPQVIPPLVSAAHSEEVTVRGGISFTATLVFATTDTHNVSFTIEVIRPVQPWPGPVVGSKRHPVFLTQANHRRWAILGVSRGYVSVVYPGADVDDQTAGFQHAYPSATWGTILRRSWLASRALDHVLSLPYVDPDKVSISGHSRNGKQAMLAAAFDHRITSVVSSSSGSPGMTPYRTTSANTFAEGPGDAPSDWWLPSLSCFKGHEHRLPIDSHGLLGLIAPRPMLASTAWTDGCEPTWAVERAYRAGQEVYTALGVPEHLRILYRPGQHHGFLDVNAYFDFFDAANGRPGFAGDPTLFPERLLHGFDWPTWRASQRAEDLVPPAPTAPRSERVGWGLGTFPGTFLSAGGHYGEQCEEGPTSGGCYIAEMMTHTRFGSTTVTRADVSMGEYISASVYFSANSTEPLPVVIWMHPLSYHSGFNEGYIESTVGVYYAIAASGYAVVAFDAMGFGTRGFEFDGYTGSSRGGLPLFYRRYPRWSVLGKLVHDGLAALDLVTAPVCCPLSSRSVVPPYSIFCLHSHDFHCCLRPPTVNPTPRWGYPSLTPTKCPFTLKFLTLPLPIPNSILWRLRAPTTYG